MALALLPCLAVLAGFGGTTVAGILLVGSASVYILDALRYKEGSFAAAWLTMGLANAGMLFEALIRGEGRSILLSALIFLANALALTLTGAVFGAHCAQAGTLAHAVLLCLPADALPCAGSPASVQLRASLPACCKRKPMRALTPHCCRAGLWATLQFKWIQLQYPAVVLAFEKLLLTGWVSTSGWL